MLDDIFNDNPHLLGVMTINGEHSVHFHIEDDYIIPKQDLRDDIIIQGPTKHNNFNYVIISSKVSSPDYLLNVVRDIITFNKNKKAKESLFEETLKSLQKIFNDSSVEELKDLVTTLNSKTEINE